MQVHVTGISGYVGGLLAPRLTAAGHDVRGLARHPERVKGHAVPIVRADLSTGAGVDDALRDIEVAYYLVHSMEGHTDFVSEELYAARQFAERAGLAGVKRIVYMSVLTPDKDPAGYSAHVKSRVAVEHALAAGGAEVVALRASIVVGAESRSFRFLLRLVERMPVIFLPPWRHNRTMPIDERDLLTELLQAATVPVEHAVSVFDAVGPDATTYQALIESIRDHLMIARPTVPFPFALTAITAPLAATVAGEDLGLVQPLMASLGTDLMPRTTSAASLALGPPRYRLDAAIEHALAASDCNHIED